MHTPATGKKVKAKDFCASLTIGAEVVYGEEKSLLFHLVQIALKVQTNDFSLPFYTRVLFVQVCSQSCATTQREVFQGIVWLSHNQYRKKGKFIH
jgi:hypothetical protein